MLMQRKLYQQDLRFRVQALVQAKCIIIRLFSLSYINVIPRYSGASFQFRCRLHSFRRCSYWCTVWKSHRNICFSLKGIPIRERRQSTTIGKRSRKVMINTEFALALVLRYRFLKQRVFENVLFSRNHASMALVFVIQYVHVLILVQRVKEKRKKEKWWMRWLRV